jgi:TonB family protein
MNFNSSNPVRWPQEVGLLPVCTMVLWTGCLTVGAIGLAFSSTGQSRPKPAVTPVELLNVDVVPSSNLPRAQLPQPPPAEPEVIIPPVPPLPPPSPAIAFAAPGKAPATAPSPAQVQQLVLGQGEGRQPVPEYPREAVIAHEEGVVVVQFDVEEDGRVANVEAVRPCGWPILNHAAVLAVREEWHFSAGSRRTYQVSIEFRLDIQ